MEAGFYALIEGWVCL